VYIYIPVGNTATQYHTFVIYDDAGQKTRLN